MKILSDFQMQFPNFEINANWLNKMQIYSLTVGGAYRNANMQFSVSQINIRCDKHFYFE